MHLAPAPLDPQPQRGGLAELAGEGEQPHRLVPAGELRELGRGREAAVEDEEKLVLLAAPIELGGEGAIEHHQIVGPLDHRDDHGDEPPVGGVRQRGVVGDRLHESTLGGHDQRTSHAVGISRALSRSLLSATSATSPSMAR